jgi:hypothetical protein
MMSRARAFLRLTQSLIEKIQQGSEIFKEHPIISNTNESMTQQNTKNTKSEKSRKPWTNNADKE